jgi:hypothetical protein
VTDVKCEATLEQAARIAKAIFDAAKAKEPVDKQADFKLTEAHLAEGLKGDLGCAVTQAELDAARKALDTAKAALAAEQAKQPPVPANITAEQAKVKTAQDALTALETKKGVPEKIREMFRVTTFDGYTLSPGKTVTKTFKVVDGDLTWTAVITTQGGSAAATAQAAAKAANPLAADSPVLDRLLSTTSNHPDLVVGSCKYTDASCGARIFINADQISTLTITDIPQGAVTVRVTGGEYFPCEAVRYNVAHFTKAPDTLIVPMQMRKGWLGIGNVTVNNAQGEAAALYGLRRCPGTNEVLTKNSLMRNDPPKTPPGDVLTDLAPPDPRVAAVRSPPIASLPLFLRGKSQVVEVQFEWDDGTRKTFTYPVVYQRFWLDAGGFFVFARRSDQSIELQNMGGTPEQQKVTAIHRETSIEANTGIVINVHPGNFPVLAFQFGIAANQDRLPSYYLGLGVRAREIGKRGLATLAIGASMQQEKRYPSVELGRTYDSTSALLAGTNKYGVTFPYISLSLGFSFGGVSEKTNVADGVQ